MSLLISLSVLENLSSFDACRLLRILFTLNKNMHTRQVPKLEVIIDYECVWVKVSFFSIHPSCLKVMVT